MAVAAQVSPALFSQIVSGDRQFSQEGALLLADYLALGERETDYLLTLVDYERAGSARLKSRVLNKLKAQQAEALKLSNRISRDGELGPETRAIYYSSWVYTAARNLTAVPGFRNVDAIAEKLALPRPLVAKVVSFLLENGLCRQTETGDITYGPSWTHLGQDSALANRQHQNWRQRALAKMELGRDDDLFFTGPMSMSREVASQIREMLPTVIADVQKLVGPSTSEVVRCLNIDWFDY